MSIISEEYLDVSINQIKEVVKRELNSFKGLGNKFVNKEITSAEFKSVSGGMGVYAQRSGNEFMLRFRTMSGVLDHTTFKFLYDLANKYSMDYVHLTTRQMIQLHDLKLDDLIPIMEECIDHGIITRGGGGNFPRNVTLSPLSGVEKEEAFDVTPYAMLVNKYFLSQIITYRLPRKFKVAFSNNGQDSANASIADLGFLAIKKNNKKYFQVYLGGSMGPNGAISVPYDELIPPQDMLYHIEAILSLFKEEGDYQNKAKARMRFIVQRMGREAFLECYKKHLKHVKETKKLEFVASNYYQARSINGNNDQVPFVSDAISQKQSNLYSVEIHPLGGSIKTKDLGTILQFVEKLKKVQVRLTMEESMIIRNLTAQQAVELLELTRGIRKTTRLGRSISCIGASICQIGVQNSQALLSNILEYFDEKGFTEDILPSISISGCTNSCARHQVGDIGFQGKKRRVNDVMEDAYALRIGGKVSLKETRLAKEYGDVLATNIPEFLYQLAVRLKESQEEFADYRVSHAEELEQLISKFI